MFNDHLFLTNIVFNVTDMKTEYQYSKRIINMLRKKKLNCFLMHNLEMFKLLLMQNHILKKGSQLDRDSLLA